MLTQVYVTQTEVRFNVVYSNRGTKAKLALTCPATAKKSRHAPRVRYDKGAHDTVGAIDSTCYSRRGQRVMVPPHGRVVLSATFPRDGRLAGRPILTWMKGRLAVDLASRTPQPLP